MALTSGFYNALLVNGNYDRRYNGDDYRNVFAAFIKDGVRRSGADDFRVVASGLSLSIKLGYAVCGGRWVRLDADYSLTAVAPPVGDFSRIDAVVLRVDENEATRAASLLYRTGTAASVPVAPSKAEATGIYELILAHVLVAPSATSVTVTDTRPNPDLCGWVTTPVGYDEYFASLDSAFEVWFEEKKNQLASATLFKQYTWHTILDAITSTVAFDIPQYDSTGVDIIQVYTNGLRGTEGIDYTLNGSVITFSGSKIAGTEIAVICYKSLDGTGLGTVAEQVQSIEDKVNTLGDISEFNYICNGVDDNVKLSDIAQAFLAGSSSDNKRMTIRVHGTLGVTAPYAGDGSSTTPYRWFSFGTAEPTSRRIIVDFENCSRLDLTAVAGKQNVIFYGYNLHIRNSYITVNATTANTGVLGFGCMGRSKIEDCSMYITAYNNAVIANGGYFVDCNFNVRWSSGNAYAFSVNNDSLLRISGGEMYAYGASGTTPIVVYVPTTATTAVVLVDGMSCPTYAVSGYIQNYAVSDIANSGLCAYNNIVTNLTVSATGQTVAGTIKASKYNRV